MATKVSIVRNWGAVDPLGIAIKSAEGFMSTENLTANLLIDKLCHGVQYRMLTQTLSSNRYGHTYQFNDSGPSQKKYLGRIGMTSDTANMWHVFHFRNGMYAEGSSFPFNTVMAIVFSGRSTYAVYSGDTLIRIFNIRNSSRLVDGTLSIPAPAPAFSANSMMRVGRCFWLGQIASTRIIICRSVHDTALYFEEEVVSPVVIRSMSYDGKYVWVNDGTNLYQCSVRSA